MQNLLILILKNFPNVQTVAQFISGGCTESFSFYATQVTIFNTSVSVYVIMSFMKLIACC